MSSSSQQSPSPSLRRTPFFSFHKKAGAQLIDFGGWEMPVRFDGIIAEHKQVRASVGLFDVSHMGEIRLRGPKALQAADHLVTNDLSDLQDGQARYSPMCTPAGGIVDDLIVYRISDDDVFICVNAANRAKDTDWIREHNPFPDRVQVLAEHDAWAQVAIQGRDAPATLQQLTDIDLEQVPYYHFARGTVAGVDGCVVARTGYTGEDGFEVFLPEDGAGDMWPAILDAGRQFDIAPIGLGARDTLRLEARMLLYGQDMTEDTTPLEAGLFWAVKLKTDADFVGKDALIEQRKQRVDRRLAGLKVQRRIARPGCTVLHDDQPVGEVTSGTRSPTLGENIALAYVPRKLARPGTELVVDIRGRSATATVHRGPFYKRDY